MSVPEVRLLNEQEGGDRGALAAQTLTVSSGETAHNPGPNRDIPVTSIKQRAIHASLWTFGGYGFGQVMRLANSMILSRLLFPEAFGLMTLVSIFVQSIGMFSDVGTGLSIIRSHRGDDRTFLNTAWTIQVMRGVGIWLVVMAATYPAAVAYAEPQMLLLIPVVALREVISGFNSTKLATASRDMDLKPLTIVEIASQVAGLAATVGYALLFRNVWALVAGALVAAALKMLLSHISLSGHRNRFEWNSQDAQSLVRFGRWVFVSTALTFCVQMSDRLVFGKLIPAAELGIYGIAFNLASIPGSIALKMANTISFPIYSRARRESGNVNSVFARPRRITTTAGGICVSTLILCGPALVRLLYDDRYHSAGWMLQLLATAAWFQILESHLGAALLALGHSRLTAGASGMKLLGMLILIPIGFRVAQFPGAVAGYAASESFRYLFTLFVSQRRKIPALRADLEATALLLLTLAVGYALSHTVWAHRASDVAWILGSSIPILMCWIVPAIQCLSMLGTGSVARRIDSSSAKAG